MFSRGAGVYVAAAHAADADAGDVQLFARRRVARAAQHAAGHDGEGGHGRRAAQESPPGRKRTAFLANVRLLLHG